MICHIDYDERVVASFDHQINQNTTVSIEGISLEHFNALPQIEINSSTKSCPQHAVFHSFFSVGSKQDAATTTAHRKILIELLK